MGDLTGYGKTCMHETQISTRLGSYQFLSGIGLQRIFPQMCGSESETIHNLLLLNRYTHFKHLYFILFSREWNLE